MNPWRWIRTKDGWYICELRGVCFLTWVSKEDKAHAFNFPAAKIADWLKLMKDWSGKELEAVVPFV